MSKVVAPGVSASDTSVGGNTVSVALPVSPPEAAAMTEVPAVLPSARPVLAEIDATPVEADVKVDTALMSRVVLSSKVPSATNCCALPILIDGFTGATAIDTSLAGRTVRVAAPLLPSKAAVMTEVPAATPIARPRAPSTVPAAGVAEVQADRRVMSRAVPSE